MLGPATPPALCELILKWAPLFPRLKQYESALFGSHTQYQATMRLLMASSATFYRITVLRRERHLVDGIPKTFWKAKIELFVALLYASTLVLNHPRVKSSLRSMQFASVLISTGRRSCLPIKWKKELHDHISAPWLSSRQFWKKHSYILNQKEFLFAYYDPSLCTTLL